jgi:glycosyltransferase involved in cell wall biosynthesis
MRIAINYTAAISLRGEGIGRYTRNLVDALLQVNTTDRFTLFSSAPPRGGAGFPSAPNARRWLIPIGTRGLTAIWHRWRLPLPAEMLMGRADVLHEPNFGLPPALRMPRVVTIHDLVLLTHLQYAPQRHAAELTRMLTRAVLHADHLLAVSQRTADDLTAVMGVARDRISVAHLGVDPSFQPVRDRARLADLDARYGLMHPFVLSVGLVQPRKNYERLIAAFARATQSPDGPRMLVIAGRRGWESERIVGAVERYSLQNYVRFLEYVPEVDLPVLYSTADVFALVSLYEGFGLPLLEAMACGAPSVTSTAGSLPEVAGDAALVVNPEDEEAIAAALVRLTSDAELRRTLNARGIERAATFTWEASARAHLAAYRAVVAR